MLGRLEEAFSTSARATGRLALILVRRRTKPSELRELADMLMIAANRLQHCAENFGLR